ncbi:MAG: hypothetical protein FJ033_01025 [Chloroflexi bacterium]|nr:hypothetical protein [Chloroflexota bacterium]
MRSAASPRAGESAPIPFPRAPDPDARWQKPLRAILGYVEFFGLAFWIGGLATLALLAPLLFQTIPSRDLAGEVFGRSLDRILPLLAICVGLLICATATRQAIDRPSDPLGFINWLVVIAMAGIIGYVILGVIGEMRILRMAMPLPLESTAPDDPLRVAFNAVHRRAEQMMAVAFVLGLILVPLLRRRWHADRVTWP